MYRPKQAHLGPSRGDVQGGASHLPLNSYDGIPHRAASRTKEPIPPTFLSATVFYFTALGGFAYLLLPRQTFITQLYNLVSPLEREGKRNTSITEKH